MNGQPLVSRTPLVNWLLQDLQCIPAFAHCFCRITATRSRNTSSKRGALANMELKALIALIVFVLALLPTRGTPGNSLRTIRHFCCLMVFHAARQVIPF